MAQEPQGWTLVEPAPQPEPSGWTLVQSAREPVTFGQVLRASPAGQFASAIPDMAIGAVKRLGETGKEGGALLRKIPGVNALDRLMPPIQVNTTPSNIAQRIGGMLEQGAELMIPAGRVAKLTATAPLIGQMAAQGAVGAGITGMQTGGDVSDMVTSGLLMGLSPAVAKIASAVGHAVTERLPEKLYTQVFKLASDDLEKAYRAAAKGQPMNPTLAREALERGLVGSSKNMAVYSAQKLDALENQLQAQAGKRVLVLPKKAEFIGILDDIEQHFSKGFFSERAQEAAQLKQAIASMPGPSARATDMLKVKRFLDGLRNTSSFRLDQNLAPRQEELKIAADLVRSKLHSVPEMSKLIGEERVFIQALDAIVSDAVKRANKPLLSLTDVLLGGGGLASGVPGAGIGGMAAVRAFQQPPTLTGLGQALYRMGQSIPSDTAPTGARLMGTVGSLATRADQPGATGR